MCGSAHTTALSAFGGCPSDSGIAKPSPPISSSCSEVLVSVSRRISAAPSADVSQDRTARIGSGGAGPSKLGGCGGGRESN